MDVGTVEQKHSSWHPSEEATASTFPSNNGLRTADKRQFSGEKQSRTGDSTKDSILRFLEFVKANSSCEVRESKEGSKAEETRVFVPYNLIQDYFKHNEYKELRSISSELIQTEVEETPVPEKDVGTRYTAIFGILLSISCGRYIEYFVKYGIDDTQLPFNTNALQSIFKEKDLPRKFWEKQWEFCAPVFEPPLMDAKFEDDRILPIISREALKDRGNATTWKINIHPSYNKLLSEKARMVIGDDRANTFKLKTYRGEDAEAYYQSEVEAFKPFKSNPSVISFYGSYRRAGTYNLILEYTDKGTLEDFFLRETPPTIGDDIIKFWEHLFKVIDALRAIHGVGPSAKNRFGILQGSHRDVKPANILVIDSGSKENSNVEFKLADLGICHFKRNASYVDAPPISTEDTTHNTQNYGAPGSYSSDEPLNAGDVKFKQNVDIWSLGCVLSEASRWIIEGAKGVSEYRRERRAETSHLSTLSGSDCFHNGATVLEAVVKSHEKCQRLARPQDPITGHVIKMIDHILAINRSVPRPTATELWNQSRQILEKSAREASRPSVLYSKDYLGPSSTETKVSNSNTALQTHGYSLSNNLDLSSPLDILPKPNSMTALPRREGQLDVASSSNHMHALPSGSGTKQENNQVDDGDDVTSVTSEKYSSVPSLTVSGALEWKRRRKTTRTHQPIANSYLQKRLNGRDHVFLVDDAASMKAHWDEVVSLFEVLSYIVKDTDPDGFDLHFTISEDSVKGCKTSSKPLQVLKSRTHQGQSDINLRLNSILDDYKASFEKHKNATSHFRKPKKFSRPLSIYVFTDGVWESKTNPMKPIKKVVQTLVEAGKDRNQIGIQFISFGNSQVGLERLEALDAGLDLKLDIVDTEPSDGNVWKMLLGSINDSFDKAGESTSSMHRSKPAELPVPNPFEESPNIHMSHDLILPPTINAANTGRSRLSGRFSEDSNREYPVRSKKSSIGPQRCRGVKPASDERFSQEIVAGNFPVMDVPRFTKDVFLSKIKSQEETTTIDSRDYSRESRVMDEFKLKSFVESSSRTMKKDLEELLMGEYYQIFDDNKSELWRSCTGRSSTQRSSSQYLGVQSVSSGSSTSRSQKRIRSNGDEPEEWDDEASKRPINKKQKEASLLMQSPRRYSCPYHKHNPSKFRRGGNGGNFDACDGQGFKDIGHMKEHLHRAHYEKFKCPRCKILLRPSDFEEHSLAFEACHPRPEHEGDPEIGFSHAFDISLKMRKKSASENEGRARWVEIYRQLFPSEPVPSPYVEEDEEVDSNSAFQSLQHTRSINSATPSSMARARLAGHVDGTVNNVVTQLTRGLLAEAPGVIRDTSDEYLNSFQQSHLGASGSQIINPSEAQPFGTDIAGPSNAGEVSPSVFAMKPKISSTVGISQADASGIFQNCSRQVPLSLDSGYGPDSTETIPPGTSDDMNKQPLGSSPNEQLSLNQSQLDGMIKRHINDAFSDMSKAFENRLTQLFSNTMNTMNTITHLPNNTYQELMIAGPEQVPERQATGQAEKTRLIQNFGGVSDDTAPTHSTKTGADQFDPVESNGSIFGDDFGLGGFSPLFDSTPLQVNDAPS